MDIRHVVSSVLSFAAVSMGLIWSGCEDPDPDDEPPPSRFVTDDELIGSWRLETTESTYTLEFGLEGRHESIFKTAGMTDRRQGSWELSEAGRLTRTLEEDHGNGGAPSRLEVRRTIPSVTDEGLSLKVLYRMTGEGEGLDGDWELEDFEEITQHEGSSTTESYESLFVIELTIEGEAIDYREEETISSTGEGEPQTYFQSERRLGTVRAEGEQVWVTYTEIDSRPIPEEEREEAFFGWRLAPNVITFEPGPDGDPTDTIYTPL